MVEKHDTRDEWDERGGDEINDNRDSQALAEPGLGQRLYVLSKKNRGEM